MKKEVYNNYKTKSTSTILRSIIYALERNKIGEILVIKGYISTSDLKSALKTQKKTTEPLGAIFRKQSKISRFQLFKILTQQKLIKLTVALLLCTASICSIPKKSYSSTIGEYEYSTISFSHKKNASFNNIAQYPKLFGASEKRSKNLRAFTKWANMFEKFNKELNSKKSSHIIKSLKQDLSLIKSRSIHDMAMQVNSMMNKQKYITDNKNWGKSDYWATPIEFMTRGGDCEDYAIAKYAALRALGVPESRLRIAIVQDQKKNIPHAILIVYSEKGAMVLDNQIKSMRSASSISHYKPIFSINRNAWWLHTTQEKPTTIVASAK